MNTIYRATNTENGKSYIGFDSDWPSRQREHQLNAARGQSSAFYGAIRKYGWDAFEWTVIEQSEDGMTLLSEREEFWIREFDTHCSDGCGYNMTYGGQGAFGRPVSEETRAKMRAQKVGKPSNSLGHKAPHLVEFNNARKGKPQIGWRKEYRITDTAGKTFTIVGLKQFAQSVGISASGLSMVANGTRDQHRGYKCERV